jgi:hypothetical protein
LNYKSGSKPGRWRPKVKERKAELGYRNWIGRRSKIEGPKSELAIVT